MRSISTLLSATALFAVMAGPAFCQNMIGIKFVGGSSDSTGSTIKSTDKAGAPGVMQANWNALSGPTGTSVALKTDDGNSSKATVTYSSALTWKASEDASKGADYALMDGYLDTDNDGNAPSVKVEGIPYATYDVYVYFNGDSPNEHRQGTYTINSDSISVVDGETFSGTYKTANDATKTANYVVFRGISGPSFSLACKAGPSDGVQRCIVNAVQIVKGK